MDRGSLGDGPVLCPPTDDGCEHVLHAKAQSPTTGSNASQNHAVDAGDVHFFLPVLPGRPGFVLGG